MTLCALSVQLLSEKISGAEGTKLEEDFLEMERVSPAHAEGCSRPAHHFHSYARDRTGRSRHLQLTKHFTRAVRFI